MSVLAPRMMSLRVRGSQGRRTYTIGHRVECTASPTVDTPFDVRAALKFIGFAEGIPLLQDPAAVCTDLDTGIAKEAVKNTGGGRWFWETTSVFETATGSSDPAGMQQQDPLKRPARLSIRHKDYTAPVTKDADGAEVKNTAGDVVRREKLRAYRVITIDKVVAAIDPDWLDEAPDGFLYSRNDADWNPYGPYAALFKNRKVKAGWGLLTAFTADVNFEAGGQQVAVHAEVLVDRLQHTDAFWDEGYRAFQDEDDEESGVAPVEILDSFNNSKPSQPTPLDGKGFVLAPGKPKVELARQYYDRKDWAVLPL